MSSDVAISVRGLSKAYTIQHGGLKRPSFREAVVDKLKHPFKRVEEETFWALNDVSFDVKKGEVVGIIGRNGAGKSTLLKVLSRIVEPTKGGVDLFGRVGSLLEVGTGFHPELTGRENIYLNGAILGMRREEIRKQFDAIVEFAEVERFLDTPVKRYSSGMYVRLAFAVAAHLNPEILIVDEVLAVGDAQFQKKCLGKMKDVANSNRTVLFVSHNMQAVSMLCDTAVFLKGGRVELRGSAQAGVSRYLMEGRTSELEKTFERKEGALSLRKISVKQPGAAGPLKASLPTVLTFVVESKGIGAGDYICGFTLCDEDGTRAFSTFFNDLGDYEGEATIKGERTLKCTIPAHTLNEGNYVVYVDVGIAKVQRFTTDDEHYLSFQMTNPDGVGSRFGLGRMWRNTPLTPLFPWEMKCGVEE